jgi:error-prone DNA polymerase
MTANVITYRGRSAAREVGKTLGFDPVQVDRLAKVMNNFEFIDPGDSLPRQMSAVGLDLNSDRVRLFARLWGEMQDLPRHLGQHSGGMVICQGQLDAVRAARETPACPAASSSSGTRTTAPTWGSSRSICSASA